MTDSAPSNEELLHTYVRSLRLFSDIEPDHAEVRKAREAVLERMRGNVCFTGLKPVLPFVHWSKDPLIPYKGCECCNCVAARAQTRPALTACETAELRKHIHDALTPEAETHGVPLNE